MGELSPSPILYLFERQTGKFHPLLVEVVHIARWRGGENLLGHGFGHEAKPLAHLLGFSKGFFAIRQSFGEAIVTGLDAGQHRVESIHQHA